jgi:hypothetical protein
VPTIPITYSINKRNPKLNTYTNQNLNSWRYWPSYGSHLVFELVRIREDDKEVEQPLSGCSTPNDATHVIRILLDGVPVRSSKVDFYSSTTHNASIEGMFTIKSFATLVKNLEDAGGFDYDHLLGKK